MQRQIGEMTCVSFYCTHITHACTHTHAHTHTHTHAHAHTHTHTHRHVLNNTSHLVVVTHHSMLLLNSQTLELLDWKDLRGEQKWPTRLRMATSVVPVLCGCAV